ncbi:MAG: prepilin-type N-terminal cleavage/methylation domain-containing protein, partial [Aquificota bacterium]|nr:prepilin-type N-terminal cleavage/methylation domain-containing protein [Aquificota bacterium]
MRRERGLTLIELAVVLIVLGILLGIGAGILGVLIKRIKFNESREIVNANVEAVIGFAGQKGDLPSDSSEIAQAFKTFSDAYGKQLIYLFSDNLGNDICKEFGTKITLRINCPDQTCSSYQEINNVAFLIISGNGNYNLQTVDSSLIGTGINQIPADLIALEATGNITVKVYSYGVQVDDYTDDINRTEPYDDIVKWVTLYELKEAINCPTVSVSITSPTYLPDAEEDSPYSYRLRAEGGYNNKWGVM